MQIDHDGFLVTRGMKKSLTDLRTIAGEVFTALRAGRPVTPFSERFSGFDLEGAYQVAALVQGMRESRGE